MSKTLAAARSAKLRARTVDLRAAAVLVRRMNTATTRHRKAHAVAAQSPHLRAHRRDPGGGGLRLCAVHHGRAAVAALGGAGGVHRRRRHRFSRRLLCADLGSAIRARPHARSDCRQAAGGVLPVDAGGGRHHPWLDAVGRHRDPVPRNSGVRACANILPHCASACR